MMLATATLRGSIFQKKSFWKLIAKKIPQRRSAWFRRGKSTVKRKKKCFHLFF